MRNVAPSTLTILNSGDGVEQRLVRFDFTQGGGNIELFWTGVGETTHDSELYKPGASLIDFTSVRETEGLEAITHVLTLRAVPNSDLTPDVLSDIENQPYHNAPVRIYSGYSSSSTPLVKDSVLLDFTGYISKIDHNRDRDQYALEAALVSKAHDAHRSGNRKRSDQDQRRLNANDGFYRHAGIVGSQTIVIGADG